MSDIERNEQALTTRQLLAATRDSLEDTGDKTRAARARRVARAYLERRRERMRDQLTDGR